MDLLRIRGVTPLPGHRLQLTLTDGSVVHRDVDALLRGPKFRAIGEDEELFSQVRVAEGARGWPNGADMCPDLLIWGGLPPASKGLRPPRSLVLTRKRLAG